jgi:hypothetical protein
MSTTHPVKDQGGLGRGPALQLAGLGPAAVVVLNLFGFFHLGQGVWAYAAFATLLVLWGLAVEHVDGGAPIMGRAVLEAGSGTPVPAAAAPPYAPIVAPATLAEIATRRTAEADAARVREAETWPVLRPEVAAQQVERTTITFAELRNLPSLAKAEVRHYIDLVPMRDVASVTNEVQQDGYYTRDDGECLDIRRIFR